MSDIAIRVEGLGKRYRIGSKQEKYKTLRDTLTEGALRPFRAMKSLARPNGHSAFSSNSQSAIRNSKFDLIWALKDVSFEVKRGEVVGIIGRNGAGKSTLLKILSRITEPTEGYADIHGRVGSLLEVGTGFHPELTGRENIYLNGSILGMKRLEIQKQFDEIVAFAEVDKFIDTPVKHYSSGMYLRLAFSVAAHLDPEILLVDEVLAVGDVAFQRKCLGKMGDVANAGRVVLLVSHNLAAITNLTENCVFLEDGQLVEYGATGKIVEHYLSRANAGTVSDGWVDLRNTKRPAVLREQAQLEWVRITGSEGDQQANFFEKDAIAVEIGFTVKSKVQSVQLGCSVGNYDGNIWFFTSPSPEFHTELEAGKYSASVGIDPNYLRPGEYKLALKLFTDGKRQDTVGPIQGFDIFPLSEKEENSAYSQSWVAGSFRVGYQWTELRVSPSDSRAQENL